MDLRRQDDPAMSVTVVVDESKKSCSICGTSKTPLWRSGPDGPKSLCNACGIKHRKRQVLMCKKPDNKKQRLSTPNLATQLSLLSTSTETISKSKLEKSSSGNLRQSVKVGLVAFVKDMAQLQRQRSTRKRQRSEEEEAAVLLMSLSCGSVFA